MESNEKEKKDFVLTNNLGPTYVYGKQHAYMGWGATP